MTHSEIVANLKSVFTPVVSPLNSRGGLDEKAFQENLRRYAGIGLSGVVVAGSTGEAPFLTEDERLRKVELAREIVHPPELLIVGTGLESTRETMRLSGEAVKRGADAVLIVTPNYYKSRMTSSALVPHFRAVADGVRRPIIIYNIPQFTGIRMEPAALAQLSQHPNIAGLKESSGDLNYVRSILRAVEEKGKSRFRVLIGAALILLDALRAGAVGGVLGQANFAPDLCVSLYEAFRQGQMKTAEDLQRRLVPLVEKISSAFGVPGIKAALDLCGYRGGRPRPPLAAINDSQRRIIARAIREARAGLDV